MMDKPVTYEEWEIAVPEGISSDPLWGFDIYRKALFISDLVWFDCNLLLSHKIGRNLASQLVRSAGSIAANIEEGYSRGFGRDYARFLRIALGSARETRGWYYRSRDVFDSEILEHRMKLLTEVIAGLALASDKQRKLRS